jgi:hypothetical protein
VQMPYSTMQICFVFSSIVIKHIDRIWSKWQWQRRGRRYRQLLQVRWFECSEWFRYDSDGFYGEFVCVSTGVLLCALRNVGFGDFFRMLNSDVRRNTYSLRKHWRLIKIYLWSVFFSQWEFIT